MFDPRSHRCLLLGCVVLLAATAGSLAGELEGQHEGQHEGVSRYRLGEPAGAELIDAWDIAIGPQGHELPPGSGTAAQGALIYAKQCAYCHGATGREGPDHVLVGGRGSLTGAKPVLTIGSYWRYATTLFDYIYRAMPFVAPGSLAPDEVYALSAFLLHANGIIEENAVMDRETLPELVMPNRDNFVSDSRPDIDNQGQ